MAFMLCGITAMADETQHRGWKPPKVSMPYDNLTYALKAGIEDPLVTEMRNTDVKQTADLPIKKLPSRISSDEDILLAYYDGLTNPDFEPGVFRLNLSGDANFMYADKYTQSNYRLSSGWIRNGKLCAMHLCQTIDTNYYRYVEMDRYTGEISEDKEILLTDPVTGFQNYLPLFISAAYDPDDDMLYGYTSNEGGSGYSFFKAPASDVQHPEAVVEAESWSRVCASICYCEKDKAIYGVNRDNNFVRIEKDGTQTVIMPLGIRSAWARAALMYVPEEDYFIWNGQFTNRETGLYCIDYKNKQLATFVEYQNSASFSVLCAGKADKDPQSISSPIIDEADFGLGQCSGTIAFFVPSTYFTGGSFAGEVTWTAYLDGEQYTTGSSEAGSKVIVPFKDLSNGLHTFSFDVTLGSQKSTVSKTKLFIGYDQPTKPQNVVLTEDKITWEKVFRGVNGGYLDIDNLTYHIYLNGEEIGTTKNLEYPIDILSGSMPFTGYVATVAADNRNVISELSEESEMLQTGSPWALNVHIAPTRTESQAFTPIDINGDQSYWKYVNKNFDNGDVVPCLRDPMGGSTGNDDWIFTPPMNFDDHAADYELSFDVAMYHEDFRSSDISAYLCDKLNPDNIVEQLIEYKPKVDDTSFNRLSQVFTVPKAGVYYIAFHTTSKPYQYGVLVKEIDIKKIGEGKPRPTTVTGISAKGAALGKLSATVDLTMPTSFINGDVIPADTEIEVQVSAKNTVTKKGKPGSKISVEIETVQGHNEVTIIPSYNGAEGKKSTVIVFCGQDVPGPVQNMAGSVSEDNLSMHVTWDKPTDVGANGYYVNPDEVSYNVMSYNNGEWTVIATLENDVQEYTFSVNANIGLKSEWIGVVPVSIAGASESMPWMSDMLGTPYRLPAYEDLENAQLKYSPLRVLRLTDTSTFSDWGINNPKLIHEMFQNESGVCIVGTAEIDEIDGRLMLPKFSTEGLSSVGMTIDVWTGANMADIKILGEVYNSDKLIEIGKIPSGTGWTTHTFAFPPAMQNQKWIALYIDAYYPKLSSLALVSGYSIYDGVSGIGNVTGDNATGRIHAINNRLMIEGYEGEQIRIYTSQGALLKSIDNASANMSVEMAQGIYIVTAGNASSKVIIK